MIVAGCVITDSQPCRHALGLLSLAYISQQKQVGWNRVTKNSVVHGTSNKTFDLIRRVINMTQVLIMYSRLLASSPFPSLHTLILSMVTG